MLPSELKKKREENKIINKEIAEKDAAHSGQSVYTVISSGHQNTLNPNINWAYAGECYPNKPSIVKQKK